MEEIFLKIKALLSKKEPVVLAIDGPCASGKTTLAKKLAEEFDCVVIHMDDFFLRQEQRTAKRLSEPGGGVDRERFLEEVLLPLKKGREFSFRPFLCSKGTFGEEIVVPRKALYIIEGSYSHHPEFSSFYDWRLFLVVSHETQKQRLRERSPEKLSHFLSRWIPMEERYFSHFQIREKADMIWNTEEAGA